METDEADRQATKGDRWAGRRKSGGKNLCVRVLWSFSHLGLPLNGKEIRIHKPRVR